MSAKTIDIEIQKYLPLLGLEEKKSLLSVIRSFIHLRKEETGFNIKEYNKDIDEAISQVKEGDYISQDDFEKEMEKW